MTDGAIMEFKDLNREQIAAWALLVDADEIMAHIAELSPDQIQALIAAINEVNDEEWREKTKAAIENLISLSQLEAAGRALTPSQALFLIIYHLDWERQHHDKLNALFVGMSHHVFVNVLKESTSAHLDVLKQESISEPIQHHLIMLYNHAEAQAKEFSDEIRDLELEFASLEASEMGFEDQKAFESKIENLSEKYSSYLQCIDKGLTLAWNTNRSDLIEKLSESKERYQRALNNLIGQPRTQSLLPTGLYSYLEERLFSVYGNPNDPADIGALRDTDPAIEALAKLSIWYLEDYFAIGLLPQIESSDELNLDPARSTEEERTAYRRQLMQEANDNLTKLGLITVQNLKEASIFSKKSFLEWLQRRH